MTTGTGASGRTRSYEKTFEVAAPIEAVWAAITDATELSRWFAEGCETTEGLGGYQTIDWGGGMKGTQTITGWEPNTYLRVEALPAEQAARQLEAPAGEPYATEWYLEHAGGVTKVRMVASGFGEGAAWDGEYEGTYHGWDMFHKNMKFYLEHHAGEPSASILVMGGAPEGVAATWNALFGPDCFCAQGSMADVASGDRFDITTASGDRLAGVARIVHPEKKSFYAEVETLNNAIWNLEISAFGETAFVWMVLRLWGMPEDKVAALRERISTLTSQVLPPMDMGAPCMPEEAATETA